MTTMTKKIAKGISFGGRAFVLTVCLAGCQWTQPKASDHDKQTIHDVMEHAPAAELWLALARSVKAGSIESTERLAQIVVALGRNGEFSDQDLTKFDVAFPEITTGSRKLTDKDIQSLVQLGQVEQR
jgi:hypothetical protein